VADVKEGDLWYFPAGLPHSLQGLDPDGCEFVLAFDNGESSEFNTLLLTDWFAHTPPEVLAKNFGVPVEAFKNIPVHNKWIYQTDTAAPPLATVEAQIAAAAGKPPNPYVFRLADMKPSRETKSGTIRIADSTNFLVSKTIAATMVKIKPGGLRDMHWHPNADEWLYILKGVGRMTVFNTGPAAITATFMLAISATSKRRSVTMSRTRATPIFGTWKSSERISLRRYRCPIGWRTVQ
jgi:oxalate decarboxylase